MENNIEITDEEYIKQQIQDKYKIYLAEIYEKLIKENKEDIVKLIADKAMLDLCLDIDFLKYILNVTEDEINNKEIHFLIKIFDTITCGMFQNSLRIERIECAKLYIDILIKNGLSGKTVSKDIVKLFYNKTFSSANLTLLIYICNKFIGQIKFTKEETKNIVEIIKLNEINILYNAEVDFSCICGEMIPIKNEGVYMWLLNNGIKINLPMDYENFIKSIGNSNVIGRGTYGYAFYPPLKCITSKLSDDKRYENGVSKLMTQKNAKKEYDNLINLNIDEIDKNFNFHLKNPILDHSEIAMYDVFSDEVYDTVLLYDYGGITLDEKVKKSRLNMIPNDDSIFIGLMNIFYGTYILNKNKIYHCDIGMTNILVNENIYRLIDFGLSIKNGVIRECDKTFEEKYIMWPPEHAILVYDVKNVEHYDHIIKRTNNMCRICNFFNIRFEKFHYDETRDILLKMEDQTKINEILNHFDVFSLGKTILYVISILESKNRTNSPSRNILVQFATKLIHPSYNIRPTIKDACFEYINIIHGLYGAPKDMYKEIENE
jgi:hypothetical protein